MVRLSTPRSAIRSAVAASASRRATSLRDGPIAPPVVLRQRSVSPWKLGGQGRDIGGGRYAAVAMSGRAGGGAVATTLHDEHLASEDVHRRRWYILALLCTSLMIVIIGNTALNVAIPTLARELDASTTDLQWMVDAYSLVFAGLLFTAGTIGDRFGRKGTLQAGLLLFLA